MNSRLEQLTGSMPELVMYDLDGTLVDSVPGLALAVDRALEEMGEQAAGEPLVRTWVGGGQRLLVKQAMEFAKLSEDQLEQGIALFRKHYRDTANHELALFPGVQTLLEFFKEAGVTQTIVTNKPLEFVPDMLSALGVSDYFADSLGGECLPERKPKPLMLQTMMERFSATSANSLMVGDSSNDLIAAQAAGVPCLAVTYGYHRNVYLSQYEPIWMGDDLSVLI